MINADQLAREFQRNTAILKMQCDDLTHADSLLQTPYQINCLNWTLGHILHYRDRAVRMAGGTRLFDEAELERYRRESEPITEDGPGVVHLDRLLANIEVSQLAIDKVIGNLNDEVFGSEIEIDGKTVQLSRRLFFSYFHDTYHTGQTELLRQVTGKADKVI